MTEGEEPVDGHRFAAIDAALERGDAEGARHLTEALLKDAGPGLNPLLKAGAILRRACCDLAVSRLRRAHTGASEAALAFRECAAQSDEIVALALCARTASVLGRSVEAVEAALLATRLADDLPAGPCTTRAHLSLGIAYGWARAFAQAEAAFETAAQVVERHGDARAQLEVTVARCWVQVIQCRDAGRRHERARLFAEFRQLLERQADALAQSRQTPAPGAAEGLWASKILVGGFMSLWSGQAEDAKNALARYEEKGASPVAWLLSAQSWLAAEIALESADLEAAAMHASRMSALAAEVEHLPLQCLGHELTGGIYVSQGHMDLALQELRFQLQCERAMRAHDLEGRAHIAGLHLTARRGGAQIKELADKSMRLEKWAHEDTLTGIANLRRFNQCLTEWAPASEDEGNPLCVALIDVDLFRDINNKFSHEVGNQALRGIAAEMVAHIRATDLAARWGGDEFAILFRGTDIRTAQEVAVRIQQAVRQRDWSAVAEGLAVSISVGVTEARAGDSNTSIVARSASLMVAQKRAGKLAEMEKAVTPRVLRKLTAWLRRAERVVVFVGAGTAGQSATALQDDNFASWSDEDQRSFGHAQGLESNPQEFASFWKKWREAMRGRKPSQAHIALVELAHRLPQVLFVTERVDGVLAMAGAENVIELYGNAFRRRCGACGRVNPNMDKGRCLPCGNPAATIRPDIVLLGEQVDNRLLAGAEWAMKRADVILVIDSDASIVPGSSLIAKGHARGARLVVLGSDSGSRAPRGAVGVSIAAPPEVVAKVLAQRLDEGSAEPASDDDLSDDGFTMFCFLTRQASDDSGITLERALELKDWELRTHERTLPWMFPLTTRSSVNPLAPTPSRRDFEILSGDGQVREGMQQAFHLMLRFYGFEWRDAEVVKAERWRNGFAVWAITRSHHDLFIARILGALTLIGLRDEAVQFLKVIEVEVRRYRGPDAQEPLRHWQLAVNGGPGGDHRAEA